MARLTETPFPEPLAERLRRSSGDAVRHFWLGQAGFLIAYRDRLCAIDPYLSDSLAQKYRGKAFSHERLMPPPVDLADLPGLDAVLCTHHHTDHMDPDTLRAIADGSPHCRFVVPRASVDEARQRISAPQARIAAVDAGEIVEVLPGWTVTAARAAHETLERADDGTHRFLGYLVEVGGMRIFHSGDTVPFDGQVDEVRQLAPDLVLLPVNGRRPELTAAGIAGNFDIAEAIAFGQAVGAKAMIAHHYGMFAFNTADPGQIDAALAAAGAAPGCATRAVRARTGLEYRIEAD